MEMRETACEAVTVTDRRDMTQAHRQNVSAQYAIKRLHWHFNYAIIRNDWVGINQISFGGKSHKYLGARIKCD